MSLPKLLSARQAAKMLGCSKVYACRLFSRGVISAQKVDVEWVVEEKEVRRYLDDKRGLPVYYRNVRDWSRDDYYYLFRCLDKMMHDRKGRYDSELLSMECEKLNSAAKAMLAAMGAYEKYPNLRGVSEAERLDPPIIIVEYPSGGSFPRFEKYGVVI